MYGLADVSKQLFMKRLFITALIVLFSSPVLWAGEDEYVFVVRQNDTARSLTESYLVRPTAWERVVQYNYLLKPGNFLKVPPELARKEGSAFIHSPSGEVEVKLAGEKGWLIAPAGLILREGDTVRTGIDSGVVLEMGEGGVAILRGETEVVYRPYHRLLAGRVNRLSILQGRLEASIPHEYEREVGYEIETPDSVLVLCGTRLRTEVSRTGEARYEVLEGEITVDAGGRKYVVPAEVGLVIRSGAK